MSSWKGSQPISLKLKEMYQMITLGGDAELELVDSLDPFSEGVVFSLDPRKKVGKISLIYQGRKDFEFTSSCVCTTSLQANTSLCYG
ncbi:unnamed protein product [Lactuca virosa]|uniref:Uncharacterized protein n=1 Tax=Lactuca virosa TaxID=75947 RepID=A0AAU9LHR3_9ASTR|nr:unnamed protein product [Lactuca virosa]